MKITHKSITSNYMKIKYGPKLGITSKGFFSYSASRALSSAGLTSARNPLMSAGRRKIETLVKY